MRCGEAEVGIGIRVCNAVGQSEIVLHVGVADFDGVRVLGNRRRTVVPDDAIVNVHSKEASPERAFAAQGERRVARRIAPRPNC